jgi:hypothetical protein
VAPKQSRRLSSRSREGLVESGAEVSAAVRKAATVLESELSSSLAGVRRLESRFTKDRRVDEKAFDEVVQRLRRNAHEFIDMASSRLADLRSEDVQDLSRRLTADAHDLFDTMINMVGMAPDVINRLAARTDEAPPVSKRSGEGKRRASSRPTGTQTRKK